MDERFKVFDQFGQDIKISVNVTGNTIAKEEYWEFLISQYKSDPFTSGSLCIEITEQDAVSFNEYIISEFKYCREMGIHFAIDDFSAGQTSIKYLKDGIFDLIKFDGSLVRTINENPRCKEIISSLTTLADSLQILSLAEYVENESIRQTLHESGCNLYQGYLYSPAVPLEIHEMAD